MRRGEIGSGEERNDGDGERKGMNAMGRGQRGSGEKK